MGVRVYVTGRLCLESAGRLLLETQLGSRQGRLALAYLVCERRRSIPREELAEVVVFALPMVIDPLAGEVLPV